VDSNQVVLKQINPTQKDSATIEFSIAQKLLKDSGANKQYIMLYLDLIEETPDQIWLVIEKVNRTKYGIDLTEYITHKFFQEPDTIFRYHARTITRDLILGLHHIADRRIILRDLKADNVLIDYNETNRTFSPKWTDFGLAVDLDAIRRPGAEMEGENLKRGLIGFWYDTQKLVPRPAWKRRRPPEDCYKVWETNLACYDIYMLGVLLCSMACGIDWAHLEKKNILVAAENIFGNGFAGNSESEIKSWEIGKALHGPLKTQMAECFSKTFGEPFAETLFEHVLLMLQNDWTKRPHPLQVYKDISQFVT